MDNKMSYSDPIEMENIIDELQKKLEAKDKLIKGAKQSIIDKDKEIANLKRTLRLVREAHTDAVQELHSWKSVCDNSDKTVEELKAQTEAQKDVIATLRDECDALRKKVTDSDKAREILKAQIVTMGKEMAAIKAENASMKEEKSMQYKGGCDMLISEIQELRKKNDNLELENSRLVSINSELKSELRELKEKYQCTEVEPSEREKVLYCLCLTDIIFRHLEAHRALLDVLESLKNSLSHESYKKIEENVNMRIMDDCIKELDESIEKCLKVDVNVLYNSVQEHKQNK